jgi:hypothetical protein
MVEAVAALVVTLASIAVSAVDASGLLPPEEESGNARFTHSNALAEGLAEMSEDPLGTHDVLVGASEAALAALKAHLPAVPYRAALEAAAAAAALPVPGYVRAAFFLDDAVRRRLLAAARNAPAGAAARLLRGLAVCGAYLEDKRVVVEFVKAALVALMGAKADEVRKYPLAYQDEVALALQVPSCEAALCGCWYLSVGAEHCYFCGRPALCFPLILFLIMARTAAALEATFTLLIALCRRSASSASTSPKNPMRGVCSLGCTPGSSTAAVLGPTRMTPPPSSRPRPQPAPGTAHAPPPLAPRVGHTLSPRLRHGS